MTGRIEVRRSTRSRTVPGSLVRDRRGSARSPEHVLFPLLLALSAAALVVLLYYSLELLDGLPDVVPVAV